MTDDRDDFDAEIIEPGSEGQGVNLEDFLACMQSGQFIFMPCCTVWPAKSVDARVPCVPVLNKAGKPKRRGGKLITVRASQWLAQNRPVENMTWAPGFPVLIPDRLVVMGGWIERKGTTTFNHYKPPRIKPGDANKASLWVDHVRLIYPDDANHIITWLAHRVQRPGEKINHALVLGGAQGIGKDTLLEPVKLTVGPWNFQEVDPIQLLGRFNAFLKAVILRVSEARDLGESDRFSFYRHTKQYIAAPPDVLRVDEKHLREYYVFNVIGVIITTNHKTDRIYLPAGDRRHYVAWSNLTKDNFPPDYWNSLWGWYAAGGFEHVAACPWRQATPSMPSSCAPRARREADLHDCRADRGKVDFCGPSLGKNLD
jgi:hypothetical protein